MYIRALTVNGGRMGHWGVWRYMYMPNDRDGIFQLGRDW
jgi:hypothetical protein